MTAIIWFKRDLRIDDHRALVNALKHETIIPLYIIEPDLWQQPDSSNRHWLFIRESLIELKQQLQNLGSDLIIRIGEAEKVFSNLVIDYAVTHIYAHFETGNYWTYQRDLRVIYLFKQYNVLFEEYAQFGVTRKLDDRDNWLQYRDEIINAPLLNIPTKIPKLPPITSDNMPSNFAFGRQDYPILNRQKGGSSEALKLLNSFLYERVENYQKEMSSPLTGENSCSRLSPYISYGCISLRRVFTSAKKRENELYHLAHSYKWLRSVKAFTSRLYWHCHFIQKLEDEPEIEWQAMHRSYIGFREDEFCPKKYTAWAAGKTGFPFIDACMRSLIAIGWLNFRMRAMLISFASYQLWLSWQKPAWHLARLFVDYEPGIHYAQIQMQANSTGINIPRIYNPVKQSYDQDQKAIFIRKWLPELEFVPLEYIHEPWLMTDNIRYKYKAEQYPKPIINLKYATNLARKKLAELRKSESFYAESQRVIAKHGSRKHKAFPINQTRQRLDKNIRRVKKVNIDKQLGFDL